MIGGKTGRSERSDLSKTGRSERSDLSKTGRSDRSDLPKTERSERSDLSVFERSDRSDLPVFPPIIATLHWLKRNILCTQEDSALNFQKIEPNLKSACPHLKMKTDIKNNHVFHWEQSKGRSSAYRWADSWLINSIGTSWHMYLYALFIYMKENGNIWKVHLLHTDKLTVDTSTCCIGTIVCVFL